MDHISLEENRQPEEVLLVNSDQLKDAYLRESESPTANDEYIAEFCLAAKDALEQKILEPFIESMINMQVSRDRKMTVEEAVYLTYRVFQKYALRQFPDYPEGFTKAKWAELIQRTIDDNDEELENDLMLRHVQSNVSERGVNLHLPLVMLQPEIGTNPRVLEVGCSLMEILEREMLLPVFPYSDREVVRVSDTGEIVKDEARTELVNRALGKRVLLGSSTGIDMENIADPAVREHIRACSKYANEWKDKDMVALFDFLASKVYLNIYPEEEQTRRAVIEHNARTEVVIPDLNFFHADFSDDHMMKRFNENPVQEFDVAFMSATLHQNSPESRKNMIKRALKMARYLLMLDVAERDSSMPYKLKFHTAGKFKTPFSFNLFGIDSKDMRNGPQLLMSNMTGRSQTLMLGDGKLKVAGKYRSVPELLELALNP